MRKSTWKAFAVIAVCIVAILAWTLRPTNRTDSQQIQDQITSALRGADRHSVGNIMATVSDSYLDDQNINNDRLRLVLSEYCRKAPTIDVTMTQPIINVKGDSATSDGNVKIVDVDDGNQVLYSQMVHLKWKREPAYQYLIFPTHVWRVTNASYGIALDLYN